MDNQKRTITAVAAIALLVIGIAAGYLIGNRSDQQSSSSPTVAGVSARGSATAHNDADVMFVQMMIPHHEQALAMAKMADSRASAVPVKALASAIQTAQQPEIDKMKGWLQTWGASPSTSMSMGGGMMSDSDMKELMNLQGAAFDKQFLTMMSQHHDGAISMANSELQTGQSSDTLALATSIAVTQAAQSRQMSQLLNN